MSNGADFKEMPEADLRVVSGFAKVPRLPSQTLPSTPVPEVPEVTRWREQSLHLTSVKIQVSASPPASSGLPSMITRLSSPIFPA